MMPNAISKITAYDSEKRKILLSYFQDIAVILQKKLNTFVDTSLRDVISTVLAEVKAKLAHSSSDLSFDQYLTLLGRVTKACQIPDVGLQTGRMKSVKNFGIYGYALMSSANLSQFNAVAERIFNLIYEPLAIEHHINNEQLIISYYALSSISLTEYIPLMEQVVLCGVGLMSAKLPNDIDWSECTMNCNYPKPDYAEQYAKYFPGTINFDQPTMQLCIPAKWLAVMDDTSNALIYNECEKKIDTIMSSFRSNNELTDTIRQVLLSNGLNDAPSLVKVAKYMRLSSRTLRYQLSKENTSFRQILNEVRSEVAKRYLLESDLSIQEIAYLLGYTHTQNFYRAFSQETGTTPEKFRNGTRLNQLIM